MRFRFATAVTPQEGDVTVRLQRPPIWRGTLSLTAVLTVALVASTAADVFPKWMAGRTLDTESTVSSLLLLAWLGVLGLAALRRVIIRRWPMPPIVFCEDAVWLPPHGQALRSRPLRYDELMAVGEHGRVGWGKDAGRGGASRLYRQFFLESTKRVYSLSEQLFVDAEGAERFFTELRRRLALRDGGMQLMATEMARKPALAALRRHAYGSQVLLGILAVFFLNTWLKGALSTPFGLLRWGAMAPALVGQPNESYRLLAANFLHGGWLHIIMNSLALGYLGTLIERLLGTSRFAIVYVVSAAGAMLASAYSETALLSVGASGAIFGLLGAFAVLSTRLRAVLPLGVRQPPRWWASLVCINVFLPLIWPVIDWTAHVAGFAVGATTCLLLLGRSRTLPRATGAMVHAAAIACALVCAAALTQAVVRAADTSATQETRLAKMLLRSPQTSPAALNNLAWLWALDPDIDPDHLEAGEASIREAIRRAPQTAAFRMTQAMLARRRGDWITATTACRAGFELDLAESDDSSETVQKLYAEHLARAMGALPPALRAPAPSITRADDAWHLANSAFSGEGIVATYLLAQNEDQATLALLRWQTDAKAVPTQLPDDVAHALDAVHAQQVVALPWEAVDSHHEAQQHKHHDLKVWPIDDARGAR